MPDRRRLVAHYHIYKVAGSTIDHGLRACFGADRVIELDRHDAYKGARAYNISIVERAAEENPDLAAVSAHTMVANTHFSTKLDVFPIAFVRHPLLRTMSAWRFERLGGGGLPRTRQAKEKDFGDWIEWCLSDEQLVEARNYQSRLLSISDEGAISYEARGGILRADLDLVFSRLDAMPIVGVVEHFDRSIDAINAAGRRVFPEFAIPLAQRNVTKVIEDWQAEVMAAERLLSPRLLIRYWDANEDDLALWTRYRDRLLQRIGEAA